MPYIGKEPAKVPVTAADIPDNSITAAKIVDGAITIADIADDAVTEAKLANAINSAIAANTAKTGITSGQASAITANTAKTGITSGQASAITANTAKVTNSDQTKSDIEALGIAASSITGALPAIDGASLTGIVSVPTGVIAMWHGASGAIPSGWVICDGTNSTPNLTDKFIKSAATANATGGSATSGATTLTIAQMPAHTHFRTPYTPGSAAAYAATGYNSFFDGASGTTSSTGGGGSHTHPQSEPVFFSLIFIMKT